MRPFHWIVVWLSACLAPGYHWLRGRRSILVFDRSHASKPSCCGGEFLAQRSVVTCSAPAAMIFLLVTSLACSAALAAESKRVMLLHSFGRDFKPWSEYAKSIRTELSRQSPWPVEIIEHSLVTARFSDENSETAFVDYLRALFAKHPLDLIVSIGAPAANFVQRHRERLFATTPMVLMAVDQRRVQYSNLTANDTVVAVRINYLSAFESILQVLPDTKDVMVVVGTSPIERFWKDAIAKEVEPLANRIKLSWTDELSFEALLKQASALPPHTAIFWELMIVDAAGVVHEGDVPLTRLHAVANAPIFSYDESFFGRAIVGGPLLWVDDSSRQAAAVAIRILGGDKPSEIRTPPVQFASPVFDWREMQRWGISESRLPPGSEIHFRSPTVWEQYRWQILAIATVLVLQAVMIAGLLYEHRRRRNAEIEARQRLSELAHLNRHATAGELSASIAHELNQPLGAILNNAETGAIILNSPSPNLDEMKTILDEITRDDQRATEVIRRLRGLLGKSAIEAQDIDLNETVREVFEILGVQAAARNVTLSSRLAQGPLRVSGDRIQLQQVILNLVVNGMDAMVGAANGRREVTSSTSVDHASAKISIADSGPGIPSDRLKTVFEPFFTTKGDGMGMGLSIARTIVEAHGGRIWAENHTAGGAVFYVSLPLAKAN
jgi:signal transduction histidine kinase